MVFPSRGCQTCRKRRVKCDAVQPTCRRCEKGSRSCTWNPDEHAGLLYKSENPFAQGKPRRPRASKEILPETATVTGLEPRISTSLFTPVEVQAFQYWAEDFTFRLDELPDIGHEYSSHVLFHWHCAQPGSSIHLALSALSLAVFGKARHIKSVIGDAQTFHAQSIVKTHQEMKEPPNERTDQTLLAIMLMGFYENIIFEYKVNNSHSSGADEVGSQFWKDVCHHKGASGLLKVRREGGFLTHKPLDRAVRRQLIRTIILRGVTVPDWIVDGAEYGEVSPALDIDSLMVRVANLRAKSLTVFARDENEFSSDPHELKLVAGETDELNTALTLWSETVPEDWKFSTQYCPTTSPESSPLYDGTSHIYSSHGYAAIWNRYRAVHLIVNSICIRALSKLLGFICPASSHRPLVTRQKEICQQNIESLSTDLCRSAPVFFNSGSANGNVGTDREILPKMAALLAWPIAVAIRTEGVPEPQRQWLKCKLKIAADSMGDAMLNSVIENEEFKF